VESERVNATKIRNQKSEVRTKLLGRIAEDYDEIVARSGAACRAKSGGNSEIGGSSFCLLPLFLGLTPR
jgi:hypothetical protein